MGAIVAAISWMLGKLFADSIIKFVAIKLLLTTVVLVILPIIFNNLIYDLMNTLLELATSNSTTITPINGAMTFSGFAAWLITQFKLPECVSVLTSALLLRFSLSMIPFLRV